MDSTGQWNQWSIDMLMDTRYIAKHTMNGFKWSVEHKYFIEELHMD